MKLDFYIIILFIFLLYNTPAIGQIISPNSYGLDNQVDTTFNEADTIINKGGFFSIFKGKPGKAALFSLLIPAGGQIYNKKWWKVPIALGIDGGLAYVLITNRSNYNRSQTAYENALANPGSENVSSLKQQRDFYRKWSEYSWIWLLGGHVLTVADAFVDRHLMDFDVSDDLTQQSPYFRPYENPQGMRVGFIFNLNGSSDQNNKVKFCVR